ncbi:MAG: hypothetical protein HYZ28_05080 [Myxococcales bacterium]|nr:hypothetical protein [Myxococcales bacterium]
MAAASMGSARGAARWLFPIALLAISAGVRLASWPQVFTPEGVRLLGDFDCYYHALRARRIAESYPKVPWRDEQLNHPNGADILWPPLFDQLIATGAVLASDRSLQGVERSAALLPPFLGAATVLLLLALGGSVLGGRAALPALLLALLPAHIDYSLLGRADHHVLELLLCSLVVFGLAAALRSPSGRRRWLVLALSGLSAALGFWNWMGSGLYVALPSAWVAAWHFLAPPGEESAERAASGLLASTAIGAAVLAVSIAFFGPDGALGSTSLSGISSFQVASLAATAAFAGLVLAARRRFPSAGPASRALHLLLAGLLPLLGLLAVPGIRESVFRALAQLGAGHAAQDDIPELYPLFLSGFDPLADDARRAAGLYGLGLVAMVAALPAFFAAWRKRPEERPFLLLLLVWGSALLALTLVRRRFGLYLTVPMVLWAGLGLREAASVLERRLGGRWARPTVLAAGAALFLSPVGAGLRPITSQRSPAEPGLLQLLTELREARPASGASGVMTAWNFGHPVLYFANKPVVASNFGSEGGQGSMEDAAKFWFAEDSSAAEELLARRQAGFVLLPNPIDVAYGIHRFAPVGTSHAVLIRKDRVRGQHVSLSDSFDRLLVARLYFWDGMLGSGSALGGFRLLHETASSRPPHPFHERRFKLFQVVPGAVVTVPNRSPGAPLVATTRVRTNFGRVLEWKASAGPGENLRLPYATGPNGQVLVQPYLLSDGERIRVLHLTEEQVLRGQSVEVSLVDR